MVCARPSAERAGHGRDDIFDNLDEEKTASFLGRLSSMHHESPFEHMSFTFGIENVIVYHEYR